MGVFHDQAVFRIGLELMIEAEDGMGIVDVAESPRGAFQKAGLIDIVVLGGDYAKPARVRRLRPKSDCAAPAVVVLSDRLEPEDIEKQLRAGAKGVVGSQASPATLALAIRSVAAGGYWYDSRLAASVDSTPRGWDRLTAREKQVAELIGDGMRYDEIAQRLDISGHTVRNHSRRVFEKLDVGSRVELAAILTDGVRRR